VHPGARSAAQQIAYELEAELDVPRIEALARGEGASAAWFD